jgi:hypothetical protein
MKHEKYKEFLELNVLGELTKEEEIELENHLFECDECSKEYSRIKKMYTIISTTRPSPVSDEDLDAARKELFNSLNLESTRPTFSQRINEFLKSLFSNNYTVAFGSIALILIGFFVGYLIFNTSIPSENPLMGNVIDLDKIDNGDIKIAKVDLPELFSKEDQFEFKLGDLEPVTYKGNLNDIAVQKLLAAAIKETENPGFKIKTANTIAELVSKNFIPDEKIKEAFIYTLKNDKNPGVRKGALKALVNFPYDNTVRDALLYTLANDDNASNRMDAISTLLTINYDSTTIDDNTRILLNTSFANEENEVIRYKTTKLLGGN